MYATNYVSPIGESLIVGDEDAICGVWFKDQKHFAATLNEDLIFNEDLTIFKKVKNWFDDYFMGLNPEIDFELKPRGTEFRLKVWEILTGISYGETVTYGEIALKISETMSAQAVGGAVGANPIAIIIPCHRVLGKDKRLTGYAAGLDKKKELLRIEGINFKI